MVTPTSFPTTVLAVFATDAFIRAALDQELARFGDHAIDASMLLIALDESAESAVASALSGRDWDVVVIGRGIRKPDPLLLLFESRR